jgi:hypothetical protein
MTHPEPVADVMVLYVKTGGAIPSVYHTNADCGHLRDPENADSKPLCRLPWDLRECKWCAEGANNTESDHSIYRAVVAAGKDADDQEDQEDPDPERLREDGTGGVRTW